MRKIHLDFYIFSDVALDGNKFYTVLSKGDSQRKNTPIMNPTFQFAHIAINHAPLHIRILDCRIIVGDKILLK